MSAVNLIAKALEPKFEYFPERLKESIAKELAETACKAINLDELLRATTKLLDYSLEISENSDDEGNEIKAAVIRAIQDL